MYDNKIWTAPLYYVQLVIYLAAQLCDSRDQDDLFGVSSRDQYTMLGVCSLLALLPLALGDGSAGPGGNGTVRSCAGQAGESCIFPFDYYGTVYYACVKVYRI